MNNNYEMDKAYNPQSVEGDIHDRWLQGSYFSPKKQPNIKAGKEPFSIVLPPPNVTGTLHMGHAAMLAIEDAMVRFARMQGRETLWLPGTDHAAIATQSKVENILKEETGQTRHDLGREPFLDKVREFAQNSHDTIVGQMKKMGASVDWESEAYTLDEKRNVAVNEAFKKMFDDGLIYRGHRIVNWDPVGQTTVSDDEVVHKPVKAKLYTFKYAENCPIPISTTRPETKVGDVAIAVHPEGRWREYIGETFEIEDFCGAQLSLKVVGDEAVDDNFGTGALGVTPAHSQIDFEIAQRHGLEIKQIINEKAELILENNSSPVFGLTTKKAREAVANWLAEKRLLESTTEVDQNLSLAERSGGIIEPLPKSQWFIDVNKEFIFRASDYAPIAGLKDGDLVTLKKLMRHVVENGDINILPDRFNKTYFHWIDNLRDWNISRQIWFGHRVPVWYKGEEMIISATSPGAEWTQDPDTLDTWFSSGLWTFSTLGWPNENEFAQNRHFHPTSVLETGYDILFFWVARMILMSTYLLGEIPFKTVYLHGLVRDEKGRKMSKSLGNIINPLDMIEKYGADATRLSLLIGSTPGNDVKLSEEKVESFRNFTNKLWNISRFVLSSVEKVELIETAPTPQTLADKWILSRLARTNKSVTEHFEKHELSILGEELREFTWNDLADWYLEIAKIQKKNPDLSENTDQILLYILQTVLKMWHPFMPFVTEQIYQQFNAPEMLIVSDWPEIPASKASLAESDFAQVVEIIKSIRNTRAEYKVEPKLKIDAYIIDSPPVILDSIPLIKELARLENVYMENTDQQSATVIVGQVTIKIPLSGIIDEEVEKEKLKLERVNLENRLQQLRARLENKEYISNAPEQIVAVTRQQLADTEAQLQKINQQL
jgi:valyl-tRNA synthetase